MVYCFYRHGQCLTCKCEHKNGHDHQHDHGGDHEHGHHHHETQKSDGASSKDEIIMEKVNNMGFGKMYYSTQHKYLIARCSKNIAFLRRNECSHKGASNSDHVHTAWETYSYCPHRG